MDKLDFYRQCIQDILSEYASIPVSNGKIDTHLIFDVQRDRYQVVNIGWDGYRRVHGCVLHLDIIDGKIWVQHNATEMRIGHELVAMGVPKEEIILGFQAPQFREYTEFGVA
ncbi:MAG: XisI protein [Oscillatoriales cyanobacterium SM2_2_1]|nr:XisI protein [Oscillatoriales cyanobacterium SM2_2_1]